MDKIQRLPGSGFPVQPPKTTLSRPPSNLSALGYDYVVAVTQESINVTMADYLSTLGEDPHNKPIYLIYVRDRMQPQATPKLTSYDEFKALANADPFDIPLEGRTEEEEEAVMRLFKLGFVTGIKARLGKPPHEETPDTVKLNSYASKVTFQLLCSEFRFVRADFDPFQLRVTFTGDAQELHDEPWIVRANVDLRLRTLEGEDEAKFARLSPEVKRRVKSFDSNVYGVQQLLFNLTQATLHSSVEFVHRTDFVDDIIRRYFVEHYFAEMQRLGEPILGSAVLKLATTKTSVPTPTMTLTDMDISVTPYKVVENTDPMPTEEERPRLSTLNYLCAADNNHLPTTNPAITWNWVPTVNHIKNHDGVISINRNTLANHFRKNLETYVRTQMFKPKVTVSVKKTAIGTPLVDAVYKLSLDPGQQPNITTPATGPTVLKFDYGAESFDHAGSNGSLGSLRVATYYSCEVTFQDTRIYVKQEKYVNVRISKFLDDQGGNVVAVALTEVYDLAVDQWGRLVSERREYLDPTRETEIQRAHAFFDTFSKINHIITQITNTAQTTVGTKVPTVPVEIVRDYVFPGGNVFTFKDVAFSQYQDLMLYITYVNPDPAVVEETEHIEVPVEELEGIQIVPLPVKQ